MGRFQKPNYIKILAKKVANSPGAPVKNIKFKKMTFYNVNVLRGWPSHFQAKNGVSMANYRKSTNFLIRNVLTKEFSLSFQGTTIIHDLN